MGIREAYAWAIQTCEAPNIQYDQNYRNQQTVNGVTFYDCSSFINYALVAGGFSTPSYAPNNNAFTTVTMGSELKRLGAQEYNPTQVHWQSGDILVNQTHTEMVYKGDSTNVASGYLMGAHGKNGVNPEDQVSIRTYIEKGDRWDSLYRFQGGVIPDWVSKNDYITFEEMEGNALNVAFKLREKGWTYQAIAGVLGNMEFESQINPGVWENHPRESGGYGLVQWTPASKYIDWAGSDWKNPNLQIDRLDWEVHNGEQWGYNGAASPSKPPLSFYDFTQSTESPQTLAKYFLYYYERPANLNQPQRMSRAEEWYKYITSNESIEPRKILHLYCIGGIVIGAYWANK